MEIFPIPAPAINGPVPTNPSEEAPNVPPVTVGNNWPSPSTPTITTRPIVQGGA
jgi:hypothetical protein